MTCDLCQQETTGTTTNKRGFGTYCFYCGKVINKFIDALERNENKPPKERIDILNCRIFFEEEV